MKSLQLSHYRYDAPPRAIASVPASPRDSARLFVYDTATDSIQLDVVRHLGQHLPAHSRLVFNDTKVLPVRTEMKKPTGGKIEVFFLLNQPQPSAHHYHVLVDRKILVGDTLRCGNASFEVISQEKNQCVLESRFTQPALERWLVRHGTTPVPHYLESSGNSETWLRSRYQSVLAKVPASTAAPTASLHFTPSLLAHLAAQKFSRSTVTLHVGLGTFAPVTPALIAKQKLHPEWYEIPAATAKEINHDKKAGRPIVAVGTTVCRALESAASKQQLKSTRGKTELFIIPPYQFQLVDALVTNFHLPESSLLVLVDAFLQHKKAKRGVLDLYRFAIAEGFRLYSFGDAMLVK